MRRAALLSALAVASASPVLAQWDLNEAEWILPQSVPKWSNYAKDLDLDGDTLVVSHSWLDDQVFVFVGGPGAWSETQLLTPPTGTVHSAFDLALDGDVLVVGDLAHDVVLPGAGAAFVYERSAGSFGLTQTLENPGARPYDAFGSAVDVLGDWLVVGAPYDDVAGAYAAGAVHVYRRNAGVWSLAQVLLGPSMGAQLGAAVDLDGGRLAVGARGALVGGVRAGEVRVFLEVGGVWTLEQVLAPSAGQEWEAFGSRLSLQGDRLAIASPFRDTTHPDVGRVQVFERDAGGWGLAATLQSPARTARCWFGYDVDLAGERLLVTQAGDDAGGKNAGAAWVFVPTGGAWAPLARLEGRTPREGAYLGVCGVLGDGGEAYVGASSYDVGASGGGTVMRFGGLGPDLGAVTCVADPAGSDCPCAQSTGEDQGCANSTGRGASLLALGSASVASDDLRLVAAGVPAHAYAWLFAGDAWTARVPAADGLLCAGGKLTGLPVMAASRAGQVQFGPGLIGLAGWSAGATQHLQVWYRDPGSACNTSNLTPAVSVTLTP